MTHVSYLAKTSVTLTCGRRGKPTYLHTKLCVFLYLYYNVLVTSDHAMLLVTHTAKFVYVLRIFKPKREASIFFVVLCRFVCVLIFNFEIIRFKLNLRETNRLYHWVPTFICARLTNSDLFYKTFLIDKLALVHYSIKKNNIVQVLKTR